MLVATAVVTGATDGIGKAMAMELARKGLNIYLISRSQEKLDATSKEILDKYPKVEVRVAAVDFSNFTEAIRSSLTSTLAYVDVGVLVNNVGVSYPFPKYFDELEDVNVEHLIRLNVDSTTWMTRMVLPGMKARRRGAIVNIASAAGVSTSPLLSQYGAAKSYVAMFTKALHYELQGFVS
jgi:17beta-estradiol 17-dehydrogenase / very-long-chain 3-oxoacyl-CoA reductase